MSVVGRTSDYIGNQRSDVTEHTPSLRILALGSLALATLAYLHVLFHVTGIVGGSGRLFVVVVLAALAAIGAARLLTTRGAGVVAAVVLVGGTALYYAAVPYNVDLLAAVIGVVRDWLAIMSGFTVLAIVSADIWAATFAPAPIFLSWYFGLRGQYIRGGAVAGVAMVLFMLSGDLELSLAMLGVVGVAGTVGFGELARRRAGIGQSELVVVVLAIMIVGSLAIPIIPADGGQPISPGATFAGPSLEESLIGGGGVIEVTESPSLSPEVRFTVSSPIASRWRVDAFDRYTGDGWIQTGEGGPLTDVGPESDRVQRIEMAVQLEVDRTTAMPTMWQPVGVEGVSDVQLSPEHGLIPENDLQAGDRYFVSVERPDVAGLARGGTGGEYPEEILERYTQLPDSTPEAVGELTTQVVANTDGPYAAAMQIERYLIATNNYSLDVPPPSGDMAYELLFERDAGYCTWFATTMVAMLRTQDIPARLVTGYSAGERTEGQEWVVRGMNAHAWVEVYIPDVGWIEFDPTPSDPYNDVRNELLENARAAGTSGIGVASDAEPDDDWEPTLELPDPIDANLSSVEEILAREGELRQHCTDPRAIETERLTLEEATIVCNPTELEVMGVFEDGAVLSRNETVDGQNTTSSDPATGTRDDFSHIEVPVEDGETGVDSRERTFFPTPTPESLSLLFALAVGTAVGVRRTGVGRRARFEFALRWQGPTREPRGAVERAWQRLELHLSEAASPRHPEETVRAYVDRLAAESGIDDRVRVVALAYEQARHSEEALARSDARETVELVDELIGRSYPRFGR